MDCPDVECETLCCGGDGNKSQGPLARFYNTLDIYPQNQQRNAEQPSSSAQGGSASLNGVYRSVSTSLGFETEKNCCENILSFCETEICIFFPSLTFTQRLWGCCICTVLAFVISMGSFCKFTELIDGNPIPFVTQYTAGTILATSSTCILYGPVAQAKTMFHSSRFATSIVFLVLMFLIIFLACSSFPIPLLIAALVFLQYLTLTWYSLSFIPWGREFVRHWVGYCLCSCISKEEWNECMPEEQEENSYFWGFGRTRNTEERSSIYSI